MRSLPHRIKAIGIGVLALLAVTAVAAPAHADNAETYASSVQNGMWHMGTTQFYNGDTKFTATIRFNDLSGDAYCTQLRMRAYTQDGSSTLFTMGSVCGGRTGTLTNTITASPGYYLTEVDVWTVRADGRLRSYVWAFYG